MKLIQEFKEFAVKGNVMDLAVAVIVGGAFGKIVTSFVNDILMPPLAYIMGGLNFKDLKIVLSRSTEGQIANSFNYGNFVQIIVEFLIIAFSIFMMIKVLNLLKRKDDEKKSKEKIKEKSRQEILLEEIRDLLKRRSSGH